MCFPAPSDRESHDGRRIRNDQGSLPRSAGADLAAPGRGHGAAAPAPRRVRAGVPGERCALRRDGVRRFVGGEPQQPAADRFQPASPSRPRRPEPACGSTATTGCWSGVSDRSGRARRRRNCGLGRCTPTGSTCWASGGSPARRQRGTRSGSSASLARPGAGTVRALTAKRSNGYPGKAAFDPGPESHPAGGACRMDLPYFAWFAYFAYFARRLCAKYDRRR